MRTSLLTLTLLTLGISTVSVSAYLSPDEVFTDLNIVEDSSASSEGTSSQKPVMQEQDMSAQAETSPEPSAMPMAPAQEAASESSSVSATPPPSPTQAPPAFYRSGGEEIPVKEEVQPKPQEIDSPFYEPPVEPENEPMEQESPVIEEETEIFPEDVTEEPIEEEVDQPEEVVQPAAEQSGSMLFSLIDKLKYVAIAIVLGAGGFFFLMRKKPKTVAEGTNTPGSDTPDTPPVPIASNDGPQSVEQSSERLQHALEAMSAEETAPPPSDEKPKDETDTIGFSDATPPTRS